MPRGTTATALTNKTEFMRWLDYHAPELPSMAGLYAGYTKVNRHTYAFGQWVRARHREKFDQAYTRFWLKSPQLYDSIYTEINHG